MRLVASWCVVGWIASGCLDSPNLGNQEQAIVNGVETTGHPAVAALYTTDPGGSGGSLCTATLISPTWLLTAAHCVDPAVIGTGRSHQIIFHPTLRSAPTGARYPVKRVIWHTAFDLNNLPAGHDIGLVELEAPAPADIAPLPYLMVSLTSAPGDAIRLVGYGVNNGFDTEGQSAGVKRELTTQIAAIHDQHLEVGGNGQTACTGDGGGPGLVNAGGVDTVVAVHSYGFIFCLATSYMTRVDKHLAWIAQHVGGGSCTPACSGRECGSDGCGGSCGSCNCGATCNSEGSCVAPESPGRRETEDNGTAASANALSVGDEIHGTIALPNDEDWFTFSTTKGAHTVLIDDVGAQYGFTLYKKAANKPLEVIGQGRAREASLSFSFNAAAGTHFVRVYAQGGHASSNLYRLRTFGP